ncbi:hypothetical protein AAC387_Pa08g0578 [Persea americana]
MDILKIRTSIGSNQVSVGSLSRGPIICVKTHSKLVSISIEGMHLNLYFDLECRHKVLGMIQKLPYIQLPTNVVAKSKDLIHAAVLLNDHLPLLKHTSCNCIQQQVIRLWGQQCYGPQRQLPNPRSKRCLVSPHHLPQAQGLLKTKLPPEQDHQHPINKEAVLCSQHLQVPIQIQVLQSYDLRDDVQLSPDACLIDPEVVARFPHEPNKAPEGFIVLLHHCDYGSKQIAHPLSITNFRVIQCICFKNGHQAGCVEYPAGL